MHTLCLLFCLQGEKNEEQFESFAYIMQCKGGMFIETVPSIFGATFPSDSLLNFNEVIPGGLYSSSSGSTDSLITIDPA